MKIKLRSIISVAAFACLAIALPAMACEKDCSCGKSCGEKKECSSKSAPAEAHDEKIAASKDARGSLKLETPAKQKNADFGRHGTSAMARERILK